MWPRVRATDEMFFAQNSGSADAGTGLNKSSVIQKISVPQAAGYTTERNVSGKVTVTVTNSSPVVINPNGKPQAWERSEYQVSLISVRRWHEL